MDRSNLKISTAAPIIPEKVCLFGGKQWSMFFIGKSLGIYRRGIKKSLFFLLYYNRSRITGFRSGNFLNFLLNYWNSWWVFRVVYKILKNHEMGQKIWQKNNEENSCLTCLLNPDFGYPWSVRLLKYFINFLVSDR